MGAVSVEQKRLGGDRLRTFCIHEVTSWLMGAFNLRRGGVAYFRWGGNLHLEF